MLLSPVGKWAPGTEVDPGKAPLLGSLVTALASFTPQLSSGSPWAVRTWEAGRTAVAEVEAGS